MDTQDNVHVPFAQLEPELQCFYSLAMMSALTRVGVYLDAIQADAASISASRIWDDYRFTPADALNFFENVERLAPYLLHFAIKDPKYWCPRLAARMRRRRNLN
ncbi:MAG TPA: hypothetical protein VGR47_00050 [Terracidiphilus sp.]|nr:hypothetical protein [Terracidiphilus sp.]